MIRLLLLLSLSTTAVFGQLPPPKNLTAVHDVDSNLVRLNWEALQTDIAGYNLFVQLPGQDRLFLWSKAGQLSACI